MTRLRLLLDCATDVPTARSRSYRPPTEPLAQACRPIEAVAVEMPGVLYDDSLWPRWLWQVLGRVGLQSSYEMFWRVFQLEYLPAVYAGRRELWDALSAYLSEIGFSRGRIAEVRVAAEARRGQWERELRPLPGVVATLDELSARGLPLVVLTNACCPQEQLRERLQTLGVERYFSHVISSLDVCAALPDETCWQALADRIGAQRTNVALLSRDARVLAGARGAGFVSIAVHSSQPTSAQLHLDRFADLLQILPARHRPLRAA